MCVVEISLYKDTFIIHTVFCRAEMQVATTQDYATDSWFWTVFTGEILYVGLVPFVNYVSLGVATLEQACLLYNPLWPYPITYSNNFP